MDYANIFAHLKRVYDEGYNASLTQLNMEIPFCEKYFSKAEKEIIEKFMSVLMRRKKQHKPNYSICHTTALAFK